MLGDEVEKSVIVVVKNKQDTLIKFCDSKGCELWTAIQISKVPYLPERWRCYLHTDEKDSKMIEGQERQPVDEDTKLKLKESIIKNNLLKQLRKVTEVSGHRISKKAKNSNSNSNKNEVKAKEESNGDTKSTIAALEKTQELCTTSNDVNLYGNDPNPKKSIDKNSKLEILIEEELPVQIMFLSKKTAKKIRHFIRSFDYSQKDTDDLYIYASEYHNKHRQYFRVGDKLDTSLENAMNLIHCPIIKKLNTTKGLYKQSQLSNVIKIRCERKDLLSNLLQMELAAYFHNVAQQTDVCKGCDSSHIYWFHCSKEDLAYNYKFYQLENDAVYPGLNLILNVAKKWAKFINEMSKLI